MALISNEYKKLNADLHQSKRNFGASGHRWADQIRHARGASILDYGCGKGTLKKALGWDISEYDPAIPGKDSPPEPHDMIVCTDVMEHIEPDRLDAVLAHIQSLMKVSGFFVIATRPAKKTLPDGRNAHLIIENAAWWLEKVKEFFMVRLSEEKEGELLLWVEQKK